MTPDVLELGYRVGNKRPRPVPVMRLSREGFLAEVSMAIATTAECYINFDAEDAQAIWATAAHMSHFPFGSWLTEDRGCGCVIGEMLIADNVVDRGLGDGLTVTEALDSHVHGRALKSFGLQIDGRMSDVARDYGYTPVIDTFSHPHAVAACVIVDG